MKRLKLDDIQNAPDLPTKEIELPEWEVSVVVQGLSKADAVEINKIAEDENGVRDDTQFEKELLMKGLKDPELESLSDVDKFYEKATPAMIDKMIMGIYQCMAWTKGEQADIAEQFPEQERTCI